MLQSLPSQPEHGLLSRARDGGVRAGPGSCFCVTAHHQHHDRHPMMISGLNLNDPTRAHLDRIWQNGTYVSEHGTDMYVHLYASSWIHERVCTWYVHAHDVMHLYVLCLYTFMHLYVCMYMVHTRS